MIPAGLPLLLSLYLTNLFTEPENLSNDDDCKDIWSPKKCKRKTKKGKNCKKKNKFKKKCKKYCEECETTTTTTTTST